MPFSCFALATDNQQPMIIQSDSANINQGTGVNIFNGHVRVIQGTTHLNASHATTYTDKNNKLNEAIALGNKTTQAHYWTLTDPNKPEMHAYADTIKMFPQKNLIYLIGSAKVTQGKDVYQAPQIEYNTLLKHVVSKASKQGRTTIILHPKKTKRS